MDKLGFGMMRLPMPDPNQQEKIDFEQVCSMVDAFLEKGFTYFDTAYMYHKGQSEITLREALVKRHPRSSFTVADKMPLYHLKDGTEEDQDRIFHEQLEKCGVEYFDYYLLHNMNQESYQTAQRLDTFSYLLKKKEEGYIKHLGFSFHDKEGLLEEILTAHPEVEFVQLQLNYLDWEDERVQSRKCYEVAVKHGKYVIVMEPVKGGKLASVPEDVNAMFRAAHPDWSPASWAVRFAASLPNVKMVLSGMSDMDQILDNTRSMQEMSPLTDAELQILTRAADIIAAMPAIACTGCRYCVDGCPQSIAIPDYFDLYNLAQTMLRGGNEPPKAIYAKLAASGGKPTDCVQCRQCESACPQHLPIVNWLERIAKTFEG